MQVDEEFKGERAQDLEIGGYDNDSEDEREIKEEEEKRKSVNLALSAEGAQKVGALASQALPMVVCGCLHSQSLAKVMFTLEELGTVTAVKTSDSDKDKSAADKEPKTIVTLYVCSQGSVPTYFVLPDLDTMGGAQVTPAVTQIFG